MIEIPKTYKLLRDMVDFKAGEIFVLTGDEANKYYVSDHPDEWGLKRMYGVDTVEKNPLWFGDINEAVSRISTINVYSKGDKGGEIHFQCTINIPTTVVNCNRCKKGNLLWAKTLKHNKSILVEYDTTSKRYNSHFGKCRG